MRTLEDAWAWYQDTKSMLRSMHRLGSKHWESLPWEGPLGKDDRVNELDGPDVAGRCSNSLEHLDDLAVLVLFSIFETAVRDKILLQIESSRSKIDEPQVMSLLDDALDGIKNGSFKRVQNLFKLPQDQHLELINQVRRYRNWVAHGRRVDRDRSEMVTPTAAFERLTAFLTRLDTLDQTTDT